MFLSTTSLESIQEQRDLCLSFVNRLRTTQGQPVRHVWQCAGQQALAEEGVFAVHASAPPDPSLAQPG